MIDCFMKQRLIIIVFKGRLIKILQIAKGSLNLQLLTGKQLVKIYNPQNRVKVDLFDKA